MRAIEVNLAAEPYRNDLPIVALLIALAVAAFGLTGWNAYAYLTAGQRRAELERQLAGHSQRMANMKGEADRLTAELRKVDQKTLASQAAFVAGILEQRNFSWTQLFNALEDVVPWNVRLIGIKPAFTRTGRVDVDLEGVARDMEGFLDFQERLLHSERFSGVVPGDYQRGDADQRVTFRLRATYRPEATEKDAPHPKRPSSAVAVRAHEESAAATPPDSEPPGRAAERPTPAPPADTAAPPEKPAPGGIANVVTSRPGQPFAGQAPVEQTPVPPPGALLRGQKPMMIPKSDAARPPLPSRPTGDPR